MELEEILKDEPAFRIEQVEKAIFQDLITNWDKASNLPKALKEKLNKELPLEIKADVLVSQKGISIKIALLLKDGLKAEAVLMRHKAGRNTVCVSSQVGCAMGCIFCLTGKGGLRRSLTAWEIIQQVLFFERILKTEGPERSRRITNIVFMGMGEPLLNYDSVLLAINILNNKNCFGISVRKISISTVGIPWAIKKLAKEKIRPASNAFGPPALRAGVANAGWPNLAVSLHTANQTLRAKIMPIAKNHNLDELSRAIDFYIKETGQRVIFEYLMLKGINDSEKDAFDLAQFVKQFKAPANFRAGKNFHFVNLITYNDFKSQDILVFKPSFKEKVLMFKEILSESGIDAVQRYKFGEDIKGACGQLAYEK
ncbi:MAG: 23S rRNA (adenine(2503)-C(2))-methyltransferase RlmN [bacterium]|nr:23S rRNA (adenine(2503)-C(2))-methyltransferase RlmN [bacterium]